MYYISPSRPYLAFQLPEWACTDTDTGQQDHKTSVVLGVPATLRCITSVTPYEALG